ncbi:DUF924 family protein [Caldimonas sp.]|uniref:DUF924 family protein n=1 Tax=Caldimonas sp. TaxID=2838790 RepID=UPI003918A99F
MGTVSATPPPARVVLDFWFDGDDGTSRGQPRAQWFRKDPGFDRLIASRFGPWLEQALAGGLQDWTATPDGTLALILVLDQFSRNVHRGSPRAFAGDARALALAQGLVSTGEDRRLSSLQRWFAYLPFEHAEDIAEQDESVRLFTALAAEDARLADALDYAHRHRDLILRFGRFPHRNAVLGRTSTAEEEAYLAQPGAGF